MTGDRDEPRALDTYLPDMIAEDRAYLAASIDDDAAKITAERFDDLFRFTPHAGQIPPDGDWQIWLLMAGRGFGKTRAGAEWVKDCAAADPFARIALVATSLGEARRIMVEGESGILACCAPHERPAFEPSLHRLRWPNGAEATLFSAAEPESLRGPQHSHAWCDEIGKWPLAHGGATRCWDNLLMGLRLGHDPRVLATTTPRAVPLMRRLLGGEADGRTAVTCGRTRDNAAFLPERFLTMMDREFVGTQLGRQELDGVMIDDIEGALWSRDLLERGRITGVPDAIARIVIGVDPPASATGDACGIVVCGLSVDGKAYVLADCSVAKASPERWARAVADSAELWGADRVVAEANQGGAMVASVLRAASINLPVKLVHASRGKVARAEPVAALYEAGRAAHAGSFPALEDEMCGLLAGGAYHGPTRSPDRADALVWALTELMLGRGAAPRVRGL
ncbi:MAG: terminase family protein [Pontixanthobacter sp.]